MSKKWILQGAQLLPLASLFFLPLVYFPFFQSSFISAKELVFKALVLLSIFFAVSHFSRKDKIFVKDLGTSFLFILLCLELLLHAVSNFFSDTPWVALYGTYSRGGGFVFELYLFCFMVWTAWFLDQQGVKRVLTWFWSAALISALYACVQKLGMDWLFTDYASNIFQGRVFSFSGNPSLLGQMMTLSILVGLYLYGQNISKSTRIFLALGTALMFAVLIFSGTRAALLALLCMGVLQLFRLRHFVFHKKYLLILPVLIVLLSLAPKDRFSLSDTALRSLHSRFEIWKGALELIQKQAFLGYGQESYYVYFPETVGKAFFTLEEDLQISADRIHNEFLEEVFHFGVFPGFLYLFFLAYLLWFYIKDHRAEQGILCALLLANAVQNQLSFSDPAIQVLMAFAWGALIAMEVQGSLQSNPFRFNRGVLAAIFLVLFMTAYGTIIKPFMSQMYFARAREHYSLDYEISVESLKTALAWTPYYSELWYELIFVDPSSMARALVLLEKIDGNSGDVLAWKGNLYAKTEPTLAAEYYIQALEKNPNHPSWLRAFADMMYGQGDCETALYLYTRYLEVIPDYWLWTPHLEDRLAEEQKSHATFLKNVPYLQTTLERMQICRG